MKEDSLSVLSFTTCVCVCVCSLIGIHIIIIIIINSDIISP